MADPFLKIERLELPEYRKVEPKQYPVRGGRETAEGKFWRSYSNQHIEQQFGPITSVDFCPVAPYNFAVSSSTRVTVFGGVSKEPKRTFSRFADIAYSGRFRADGKLLVAGGETGLVQVFDASSRLVLRRLTGHQGAVHATRFCQDKVHLVSGGDDKTVRHWDMATQTALQVYQGHHEDYVRSLAPQSRLGNPNIWASGSYDHTVRVWDLRVAEPVMTLQHGHPVEDVAFFPSGTLLASAGSNYIIIWDILAGAGRKLYTLSNHQKTVTSLALSPAISQGPANRPLPHRLLTGSLDCHLKVYDPDTFKVAHASLYPSPILSLGISNNGNTIAVGTSSGLLAVRHKKLSERAQSRMVAASVIPRVPGLETKAPRRRTRPLKASNFRYFLRGRNEKAAAHDFLITQRRRVHLAAHDKLLRRFRYADALSASLESGRPEVVAAVAEELAARGGLTAAISHRDQASLLLLLLFLGKHIGEARHAPILLPVASKLLDVFSSQFGINPAVDQAVCLLRRRVELEVQTQQVLMVLKGMLQPVIRASVMAGSAFREKPLE